MIQEKTPNQYKMKTRLNHQLFLIDVSFRHLVYHKQKAGCIVYQEKQQYF